MTETDAPEEAAAAGVSELIRAFAFPAKALGKRPVEPDLWRELSVAFSRAGCFVSAWNLSMGPSDDRCLVIAKDEASNEKLTRRRIKSIVGRVGVSSPRVSVVSLSLSILCQSLRERFISGHTVVLRPSSDRLGLERERVLTAAFTAAAALHPDMATAIVDFGSGSTKYGFVQMLDFVLGGASEGSKGFRFFETMRAHTDLDVRIDTSLQGRGSVLLTVNCQP